MDLAFSVINKNIHLWIVGLLDFMRGFAEESLLSTNHLDRFRRGITLTCRILSECPRIVEHPGVVSAAVGFACDLLRFDSVPSSVLLSHLSSHAEGKNRSGVSMSVSSSSASVLSALSSPPSTSVSGSAGSSVQVTLPVPVSTTPDASQQVELLLLTLLTRLLTGLFSSSRP